LSKFKGRSRCESVRNSLNDYLDGRLSAALRGPLRAHIQRCPGCRNALDRESRLRALIGDMDQQPSPAGLENRILAAVYAQVPLREKVVDRPARMRRPRWVLLPMALLILLVALGQWLRPDTSRELRDRATYVMVESGKELGGALGGLELARQAGEQLTRPARDKAASLLRVERTLVNAIPSEFVALILLVAFTPIVLVFTLYRVRIKGVLSHVIVHPLFA
jgi:anti-sigma factor (TIGR02949 family)